ncbi:MAG: hypothetical protein FGM33_04315 [Candidatus Kapabacteria bacterium]|nr:hypothetical protein [Candidatus Kapabacteria bacterium]
MASPMASNGIALARRVLAKCLQSAVGGEGSRHVIEEYSSVEGSFRVLRDASTNRAIAVVDAILPSESPFDEVPRDRLRAVATRLQAPYFILTNFRRVVSYRTEGVLKRLPDEQHTVGWQNASDVRAVADAEASGMQIGITSALRQAILWLGVDESLSAQQRVTDASGFFSERVLALFDDLVQCCESGGEHRDAVLRLGTSILAYVLMHVRDRENLDRLSLPYGLGSAELMTDLVGAFFRQARRRGHTMLPESVNDIRIVAGREGVFRMTLSDLIDFLHRFDPERLSDHDLHRAVDAVLQRCARIARASVPTIDALDLALRMSLHAGATSAGPQPARQRLLEIGQTQGLASVRHLLMSGDAPCEARVYARTAEDERAIVLRSSGRLGVEADVQILRETRFVRSPWNMVVATSTDVRERHRLRLLLERLPIDVGGTVVLFLPISALHDERYDAVRTVLADRFAIEWLVVSDAEALAEPDTGVCFIVARRVNGVDPDHAARCVYLRRPIAAFFPSSKASRDLEQHRLRALDTFVAYLDASRQGKLNDEAVVRMIPQEILRRHTVWEDFLVPPDVLSSIMSKTLPHVRPLRELADVSGGLRTGAFDVFAPDTQQIASDDIESQFWQRVEADGSLVDNLILMSGDEIESMFGLPDADRRLLCLPKDRAQMSGTNALTRIERAERDGVHLRTSVRHAQHWWHIQPPEAPHLVVPKQQAQRWVVAVNSVRAYAADAFVCVTLQRPELTDRIALWMNSTIGLFLSELMRDGSHVQSITVRDAQEFPIAAEEILQRIDQSAFTGLTRRRVTTLADEFGALSYDSIRPETILRDRRKLDAFIMTDLLGLTDEEQRWVYRFAYSWWSRASNIRHIANAMIHELERRYRVKPLRTWYWPRIDQLPDGNRRQIVLDTAPVNVNVSATMFGWQVRIEMTSGDDLLIDTSGAEEAECIGLFLRMGVRAVEIPSDAVLIAEVLPLLRSYVDIVEEHLPEMLAPFPDDMRQAIRYDVARALCSR